MVAQQILILFVEVRPLWRKRWLWQSGYAPDCGSGLHRFESGQSHQNSQFANCENLRVSMKVVAPGLQNQEQMGSIPSARASKKKITGM